MFVPRYAALASTTLASTVVAAAGAGVPMSMRRGFWASGISRTRSTCSKTVFERGARHDDMIGELEPALEGSRRDPLMQEFTTGLFLSRLLRAANR